MKKTIAAAILGFCGFISALCLFALLTSGNAHAEEFPGWYVVNPREYRCEKPPTMVMQTPEALHQYLSEVHGFTLLKRENPFSVIVATPDLRYHYIYFYGGDYCNARLEKARSR